MKIKTGCATVAFCLITIRIMQRTILIIIGWLAVVLGTLGVVLPPVADYAVHFTGGLVFRPLVASFPCLVVIPLMVWRLSAPLAALSGHAAGSETASDRV
ncbi:Inner membrane protein YbaN [Salmonella enterica subsp. enterica]|uniref:Inner membrane protein YbaN n=1 Tax=Salmonella enterica I TaxID=59201 RepID=A0A447U8J6_SALET|nr:Inner membrane protein YbaN [Salmonella enterica subsp. enterica]